MLVYISCSDIASPYHQVSTSFYIVFVNVEDQGVLHQSMTLFLRAKSKK